ncbi:MAG: 50S ribosomal protein L32 [Microthrixaceae bacterium]|nr:50S ribosomal protein L32 [Microthrixaceae bacterium]
MPGRAPRRRTVAAGDLESHGCPQEEDLEGAGRSRQTSAWSLKGAVAQRVPPLHRTKQPHRLCGNCGGWYGGRRAIDVD